MDYLTLIGSVGEDHENDPADIKSTAASLTNIGIGRMDRAAQTGVWDGDFDRGVRSYQANNELDVDGILLPGGPTQRSINGSLGLAEEPHSTEATPWPQHGIGSSSAQRPAAFPVPRDGSNRDGNDLEPEPLLTREDRMSARGYRYRPDPMGRLGEGDWLDALGRPASDTDLRKIERETTSPARPATANIPNSPMASFESASSLQPASQTGAPGQVTLLADGGKAFARELLRVARLEDFEDPSGYLDSLDISPDVFDGVEQAGWREDLLKILDAMRRRGGTVPKAPPGPPVPPRPREGAPPLPGAVTGRLEQITDLRARNAANRLLDGAVVKGWTPKSAISPEPAQLAKEGGKREAMNDFGRFVAHSGGKKHDIIGLPGGNGWQFTTPDKQATIVIRETRQSGKITNELQIWLPDAGPGAPSQGRSGKLQIKIRYD